MNSAPAAAENCHSKGHTLTVKDTVTLSFETCIYGMIFHFNYLTL
jgi:hypothetical protein